MNGSNEECARYQHQLLLQRDAECSGQPALAVAKHLEDCEACRIEYRDVVEFEDNLRQRLETGQCLTESIDTRLRDEYRRATERVVGLQRQGRFVARTWNSALAVAAILILAVVVVFVLSPEATSVSGSIYSGERDALRMTPGAEYRLLLESQGDAWVYAINVDDSSATLVFPFRTEAGYDYLGYQDARFSAAESRVVPHLDSGAAFIVEAPTGAIERFFVVGSAEAVDPTRLEDELTKLSNLASIRSWLESNFVSLSYFEFVVR